MGRIKSKLVKSLTRDLYEEHGEAISTDFSENKLVLNETANPKLSKKMRNVIAGYATRKKKAEIKNRL